VAANPAPGAEYFTAPRHPNQRRYEALRAYFTEGLTVEQAGARAGYTRSSMASLLRDFRAGELVLFAPPGRPGPKTAPAKDRARARVLELRRAGVLDDVPDGAGQPGAALGGGPGGGVARR
jgi:hypothetical protein